MVATLLQAAAMPTAGAADKDSGLPGLPAAEKPVDGKAVKKTKPRAATGLPSEEKPKTAWPKADSAVVEIPEAPAKADKAAKPVEAKGLPLALSAGQPSTKAGRAAENNGGNGQVRARVLSRKTAERAGVDGLLFTLEPQPEATTKNRRAAEQDAPAKGADTAESVGTRLDYSGFADAYGGGYGSRLTLVELPECILTTPRKAACRKTKPVPTTNDTEKQTLTADAVTLRTSSPTLMAAVAGEEGENGDYTATSLSPSATWDTNLNTGDFSWSYDMGVPDVPGGMTPNVGLSYSSGSIDGRTGGTNNQGSWAGDGFDLWPGYIERRYKPCADDGVKNADGNKPGDLCWAYDNAFITFNGKGGELVPTSGNEWKFKSDDGSRIARLTSSNRGNGDNDGEYWRLTDPDGNRYYFGFNRLPGWSSGKPVTNSTWTVPVYGNNSGEPCNAATFKDSWCQQAWRWNLDYAVDRHGNALAYYYTKEQNSYGRNLDAKANTRYTRGGYLNRIEYGLKSSSMYGTKALARVQFTNGERCFVSKYSDCASIEEDTAYWRDTPWDLNCDASAECDRGRFSPSFWTRKRLTHITTEVLNGSTYDKVDTWQLRHAWGKADIDYQLLLTSIERTGHTATPTIKLPRTTFAYTQLVNRLDKTGDGYAPFIKSRVSTVDDESGGQISVNYSAPTCDENNLPTPQNNTTRCFPQYIGGSGTDDPELQWFNKYVVTSLTATDRTGGSPDQVTRYQYNGGAAWHYDDDNGLTKEKHKTWSQWRGYRHVSVLNGGQGGTSAMRSQTDSYFLRGMHGDRQSPSGGTKSVSVTLDEGEGDPITDHDAVAGFNYKTVTFDKPGGKVLAKTVNRPWRHETAKKVRDWGTIASHFTGTSSSRDWVSLDDGAGSDWRTTSVSTTYDTVAGRVVQVDDRGDTSTAADNQCTRTTYATNTSLNILNAVSREETVSTACANSPNRAKDVVSDVRTAYDGGDYDAPPTKGDVTAVATLKSHNGTTATYLESGSTYDSYGRPRNTTDLTANVTASSTGGVVRTARTDGRTSTTTYSPATGFPTTIVQKTPPAKTGDNTTIQTTTTEVEPLRGQPVSVVDTNGVKTTLTYDALGRSSKVWLADRLTGTTPDKQFVYHVNNGQPVAVETRTMTTGGGSQVPSYTIYDGFLRERQTQAPGPNGGRLISDVFYDERGLVSKTFAPYYNESAQSRTLFQPNDALTVETQTRHVYDGLGRETESRQIAGNGDGGTVLGVTRTIHGGDRTTVIPPVGGTATTTLVDARGLTTELRQHHTRSATAAYDTTRYAHNNRGELTRVTDPGGNVWTYTYDQLGRQIQTTDPDKGTTTQTFNDRGETTSRTDARGVKLVNVYDGLGRQTAVRENSTTGPLRMTWTYDTVSGAQGHLAETTRYVNGSTYTWKITDYDKHYRAVRTAVEIPSSEGALAGTYHEASTFYMNGLPRARSFSAMGNITGKGWNYNYEDDTFRPTAVFSDGFRADTVYSLTGKPLQYTLGASGSGTKKTQVTNTFEWGTQRLATSRVDREEVPGVDQHKTYRYDEIGNVTSISDVSRDGTDTQCFTYDYLRRLTQAWTQGTKTCAGAPTASNVGGVAPYRHSYTYDKVGNRLTETLHDVAGDSTKDVRRAYEYPETGQPQPHTLKSVTQTGPTGTSQDTYGYDETGNTTSRRVYGTTQQLTWDAEGRLARVSEPVEGKADKVTEYLYDTDGNRLIARTDKETTLYLGDHTELVLPKGASKPKATRYVPLGGGHQAVLSDDGKWTLTVADHHGTGNLAIEAATLEMTQRRTLPFGGLRGTLPNSWPGTKGFVGGTDDTDVTGLIHLGAREYDRMTGRFISVDPLMDLTDPQQIHGYTYSNNNPVTLSDPTGLIPADCIMISGISCSKKDGRWSAEPPKKKSKESSTGGGTGNAKPKVTSNTVPVVDARTTKYFGKKIDEKTYKWFQDMGYQGSRSFTIDEAAAFSSADLSGRVYTILCQMQGRNIADCQGERTEIFADVEKWHNDRNVFAAGAALLVGTAATAAVCASTSVACVSAGLAVTGGAAYLAGTEKKDWTVSGLVISSAASGVAGGAGVLVQASRGGAQVVARGSQGVGGGAAGSVGSSSLAERVIELEISVTQMELAVVRLTRYAREAGIIK
ncbi:RHS repeat-associated core domain-containing protein [Streptomyces sp. OF3]|uniref:RHS repeat-associated core domain-containing protein n=1 Tax=Streptomyces alkaliterrae TaxID=2213162 RepID=A0A7W3WKV1_9ACTN|nr:RHS repeat-associated core domain-containing protein [Streptomyces alkaliterrae]MBB1254030.1 RHS repeat-associated core domain-containing protein [Streptomyces alkaliterrae]